jgi:Mor family transcriptional regulator
MTRRRVLTDAQVREVLALYQFRKPGCGYGALAKRYGVGESTIRDIITCRTQYASR